MSRAQVSKSKLLLCLLLSISIVVVVFANGFNVSPPLVPVVEATMPYGGTGGPAFSSTGVSPLVAGFYNQPTEGNVVLAVIAAFSGATVSDYPHISSLTQSGVSWSSVVNASTSNFDVAIWVGVVGSNPDSSVSIAVTGVGNLESAIQADVFEYSGLLSTVDVTASNSSATGLQPETGTTSTTNQAKELWIAGIVERTANTAAQSAPENSFRLQDGLDHYLPSCQFPCNNHESFAALTKIVYSIGAASSGTTLQYSGFGVAAIATLEADSAGNGIVEVQSANSLISFVRPFPLHSLALSYFQRSPAPPDIGSVFDIANEPFYGSTDFVVFAATVAADKAAGHFVLGSELCSETDVLSVAEAAYNAGVQAIEFDDCILGPADLNAIRAALPIPIGFTYGVGGSPVAGWYTYLTTGSGQGYGHPDFLFDDSYYDSGYGTQASAIQTYFIDTNSCVPILGVVNIGDNLDIQGGFWSAKSASNLIASTESAFNYTQGLWFWGWDTGVSGWQTNAQTLWPTVESLVASYKQTYPTTATSTCIANGLQVTAPSTTTTATTSSSAPPPPPPSGGGVFPTVSATTSQSYTTSTSTSTSSSISFSITAEISSIISQFRACPQFSVATILPWLWCNWWILVLALLAFLYYETKKK